MLYYIEGVFISVVIVLAAVVTGLSLAFVSSAVLKLLV